jgi:hypothetical protein
MVLAHGDNGIELTPAVQVVEIPVLRFAPGNRPIPQTIRALPHAYGTPKRLTGIRRAGVEWPLVTWRDVNGKRGSCYVRNAVEARDLLFAPLAASSRARILAAVEA